MKRICVVSLLFFLATSTAVADIKNPPSLSNSNSIDPTKEKEIKTKIGALQIPFIKNESQIKDSKVKYYAKTFAGIVFVTDNEIIYGLRGENKEQVRATLCVRPEHSDVKKDTTDVKGWVIKEKFLNAKQTKADGIKEAITKVSYFKGNDPHTWKSNISTYEEVGMGEVYDRIRLTLRAYGKNIEKVFTVEKGGKPEDIEIKVEGAKGLKVNEKGELEVETDLGTMKMTKPVAYQEIEGTRFNVAVAYTIPQSTVRNQHCEYTFTLGEYKKDYPLIIDPLLASTFIGGSGHTYITHVATDSAGNVFIVGFTYSSDYPTTPGAYDTLANGGNYYDIVISKFDSTLTTLLASTFIGGSGDEYCGGLAIDSAGNVLIAGDTFSPDYPRSSEAYDKSLNGESDVFVSKLNNTLTTLLASTFIGGSNGESADALTIDTAGNVFIAGYTYSTDYPTTSSAYDRSYHGGYDIFVSKFNNSLKKLLASTFIGGSGDEPYNGLAIEIDSTGNVFIVGLTYSSDYPTTPGAYATWSSGNADVFISKFNNTLSTLMHQLLLEEIALNGAMALP